MELTSIVELITTVGFPICVAVYLLLQNAKERDKHQQEMTSLTEALNNNTIVLEKILTKLGDGK